MSERVRGIKTKASGFFEDTDVFFFYRHVWDHLLQPVQEKENESKVYVRNKKKNDVLDLMS